MALWQALKGCLPLDLEGQLSLGLSALEGHLPLSLALEGHLPLALEGHLPLALEGHLPLGLSALEGHLPLGLALEGHLPLGLALEGHLSLGLAPEWCLPLTLEGHLPLGLALDRHLPLGLGLGLGLEGLLDLRLNWPLIPFGILSYVRIAGDLSLIGIYWFV
jgi:hypothetical protein